MSKSKGEKVSDLTDKLDRLAMSAIDQALGDNVSLEDRLDALKIIGGYYVDAAKAKIKSGQTDPDTPTFGTFRDRINGAKSIEREN